MPTVPTPPEMQAATIVAFMSRKLAQPGPRSGWFGPQITEGYAGGYRATRDARLPTIPLVVVLGGL